MKYRTRCTLHHWESRLFDSPEEADRAAYDHIMSYPHHVGHLIKRDIIRGNVIGTDIMLNDIMETEDVDIGELKSMFE